MAITEPAVTEFTLGRQIFVNNANAEFHENLVKCLVADPKSQTQKETEKDKTDRRHLNIKHYFYFVKNA